MRFKLKSIFIRFINCFLINKWIQSSENFPTNGQNKNICVVEAHTHVASSVRCTTKPTYVNELTPRIKVHTHTVHSCIVHTKLRVSTNHIHVWRSICCQSLAKSLIDVVQMAQAESFYLMCFCFRFRLLNYEYCVHGVVCV